MSYLIGAAIGSAITVGALYAWLRFNEWRWDRDDMEWDHEL